MAIVMDIETDAGIQVPSAYGRLALVEYSKTSGYVCILRWFISPAAWQANEQYERFVAQWVDKWRQDHAGSSPPIGAAEAAAREAGHRVYAYLRDDVLTIPKYSPDLHPHAACYAAIMGMPAYADAVSDEDTDRE